MIRNLVFDYGGVVVNVHASVVRQAFLDLRVARWKQLLYYRRIKRLKNDFIDGVRPTEEVLDEIHEVCGHGVSRQQLCHVMGLLAGELPPERIQRIASLRKRYRVYVLSNINETLWQTSARQIEDLGLRVDDCFDGVFLSYKMGLAKPDEAIYRQMIAETGMCPAETLYFDDRLNNVETGLHLGFQAHHVASNRLEECAVFARLLSEDT